MQVKFVLHNLLCKFWLVFYFLNPNFNNFHFSEISCCP
jgi:hypothetical protein